MTRHVYIVTRVVCFPQNGTPIPTLMVTGNRSKAQVHFQLVKYSRQQLGFECAWDHTDHHPDDHVIRKAYLHHSGSQETEELRIERWEI